MREERRLYSANQRQARAKARKIPQYTIYRDGKRASAFAYPLEKAQEVFGDLMRAQPYYRLDTVDKPAAGSALRDTNAMFGARKADRLAAKATVKR